MYKIFCDNAKCDKVEDVLSSSSTPIGWRVLTLSMGATRVSKVYCLICASNMPIFQAAMKTAEKHQSLEDVLRDLIQDEVSGYMEGGQ
jgi:hypothetical protein